MLITMQTFLQIGGNISSTSGIILFDNYEDSAEGNTSQVPFGSKPMKLQSNVIVVCRQGYLEYRMDCDEPLRLCSGDLIFCRQGQIVEFLGASEDIKLMFIAISQDYILSLERFMPYSDTPVSMSFTPSEEFVEDLHTHYRLMKECISMNNSQFRDNIIHSYVYIVLMKLTNAYRQWLGNKKQDSSPKNRQLEIYRSFVALVKENFKARRDVGFYASALFLSPGHLSRIIKSISGKTVGAWIRDYVILEAKVLLQSSNMTICQISDYLNFPNPSFFSKYFRESTGMSPGQYRRS